MTTFIHISDLHIHQSNEHRDNINAVKLVQDITKRYQGKDLTVLVTGDITDDGCEKQYQNACRILTPLVKAGFEVLPTPGNHDYGFKGNFYTEKAQRLFQQYMLDELINYQPAQQPGIKMEHLYPMVTERSNTVFIGVDSVVGNENALLHFASGEVGLEQRDNLQNILFEFKDSDKALVVYFHHHPFDRQFGMAMDDAKKVLRMLASKVDVVCFGHDHKSEAYNGHSDIDWMLASGKSSKPTAHGKLQFREITLEQDSSSAALISFNS
ncbi:metallophosphoesterase family protein [Psychromonas aquimarina]|uniref:metallophosphoesterase family protein n=1 Tax=Psychromonas aquimarina TaxID=444919 RepID=UPI0003F57CE9|nr:metallophosphoesterase [Psychromonas aquimarina]